MDQTDRPKIAVIIGGGPAGLTAAYELLLRTDIRPVICEMDGQLGGISRTVNHDGNRLDIGGHRFFSKSDRVLNWWFQFLPLQEEVDASDLELSYQNRKKTVDQAIPRAAATAERVMLLRRRLSRIYHRGHLFDYPLSLSLDTLRKLGVRRTLRIVGSYLWITLFPLRKVRNLEDFFINRFGRELYETFFKEYTEKVWGLPCRELSADWGAQRIKQLSIGKAVLHALFRRRSGSLRQKDTETSLIEHFLYPKLGPGQLWEVVGERIRERGGEILLNTRVEELMVEDQQVRTVRFRNRRSGETTAIRADYVFSSMPVRELIAAIRPAPPEPVRRVAGGLAYRDFITVGVLLRNLSLPDSPRRDLPDNWLYIQDGAVKVGRIQLFHNWSPYMVRQPGTVWLGLEYFCSENDAFWARPDAELKAFAVEELEKLQFAHRDQVLDTVVVRMPRAYPVYSGAYAEFSVIRAFVDPIANLFLIGRNGMHRYNNQDHSMLTAMQAVDNIRDGIPSKNNIWEINTEEDYHEDN